MTEFLISSAIRLLEFFLDTKAEPTHMAEDYFLLDNKAEDELLLVEKAATLKGSEEHFQGLKSDLTLMLDFLRVSARRRNPNQLVSQVREMAYDVGVIIDNFIFTNSAELESIRLNNFLEEIESFRSRFREVNLQSPVGVEEAECVGRQHRPAPDDYVVGLEKDVEMLVNDVFVSGTISNCYFIITGMGGIGKTALARQFYNHPTVVERFECRGWACVSSEFSAEEVFRLLIRQVVEVKEEEALEKMDLESLQYMLHQHLWGKRYFVVLDDVWDDTSVYHVLRALPRLDNSSTVLLTSRFSDIVRNFSHTLTMNHMSSDASWQLFQKMVFTNDRKCPSHLEKIGREILKKCNGLPLAIKEAGRQLATKSQTESAWEEFIESIDFTETTTTLELSYNELSQELKSCFLHMSFFKEGTTIRVERFVHVWNAGKLITREEDYGNAETEELARGHLHNLVAESMIMVVDTTKLKKVKSFCLDIFLHKISITKAEEEIGFEMLGNGAHCQPPFKPRHRAIYCNREKFNYSANQDKHLLSLFWHGGGKFDASPSYWESFEHLRILDFEGFGLKSLPEIVGVLCRLRYLGLRDNYLQELPHTLRHLKNLEVLDVAMNFMIEVPNIIWEMDSLRHLYMRDILCRSPLKVDSLKYLQTLTYISVNNWVYELSNLESMTCLLKLGIEELDENTDAGKLFISLAKLKNLQSLLLRGFRFRGMPPLDGLSGLHSLVELKLDGRLTRLPKFPQNIRFLTLVNSCLGEDPMPELKKLYSLHYLKMRNAYTGQEMVIWQQGFDNLKSVYIREFWHLRNLRAGDNVNDLPDLLEICSCPYVKNIPEEVITVGRWNLEQLRMLTTKKIAKVIRQSGISSKTHVDIQP